jgi:hypothetical protein
MVDDSIAFFSVAMMIQLSSQQNLPEYPTVARAGGGSPEVKPHMPQNLCELG